MNVYGEIVDLYFTYGLTVQEIAECLELDPRKVKDSVESYLDDE